VSQKIEVSEFGRTYRVKNYDAQHLVARAIARWAIPGKKIEILAGMSAFVDRQIRLGRAARAQHDVPIFELPAGEASLPPVELPGLKFEQPVSANLETSIVPRLRLLTRKERIAQPQDHRPTRCGCWECREMRRLDALPIVTSLPSMRQDDTRPLL